MSPQDNQEIPDARDSRSRSATRILYNETLVITVTLLVSLGTVVALAVFLRFDNWGLSLFRILVITLFTILPAVMYYVFIASRKQSLFQEFVSNLSRLGLLHRNDCHERPPQIHEDTYFKRTRILSYIDRFEAVYGPVGKQAKADLLQATDCSLPTDLEKAKTEESRGRVFSPATAIPVFVATFLIGLGWIQFIPPWIGEPLGSGQIMENPGNATLHAALRYNELPALFAFLGAYFFSLQMLYRRYVTNDLRASAFISVSIRIVLGVIGAWLLQVVFRVDVVNLGNEAYGLLFASFVIGVFPPVLWRIVRDLSSKILILGKVVPSLDSDLPMTSLNGLTIWHQTRLEEEDIENAYNMANADIIALLVNTKMPPERIIDWVDQAILYTCAGAPEHSDTSEPDSLSARLEQLGVSNASTLISAARSASNYHTPDSDHLVDLQGMQIQSLLKGVSGFSNLALIDHWRAHRPHDSTMCLNPLDGTPAILDVA